MYDIIINIKALDPGRNQKKIHGGFNIICIQILNTYHIFMFKI